MNAREMIEKALLVVYAGQTIDEQAAHVAVHQNAMGFNGVDANFGCSLAEQLQQYHKLTDRQYMAALKMLRKYIRQIRAAGLELPDKYEPQEPLQPKAPQKCNGKIVLTDKGFIVTFDFNYDIVNAIKAIPGRRFEPNGPHWLVPEQSSSELLSVAKAFNFDIGDVETILGEHAELQSEMLIKSTAVDTTSIIDIPELNGTLMPFQAAGVAYAMKTKRTFIADEMGLGKTIQAIATIAATEAYPALIVCPAGIKINWYRELSKWLPTRTHSVIGRATKKHVNNFNADIVVINYDIIKKHSAKLIEQKFRTVVFDESHYCKNHQAQRTVEAKKIADTAEYRLALTGTPVLNRPKELISQLTLINKLEDLGGFWTFASRYCGAQRTQWGWDFQGASNLNELNTKMRMNCYIRRLKKDVLKELPDKRRAVVPIEIDNRSEYDECKNDLAVWIRQRVADDAKFTKEIEELDIEEYIEAIHERQDAKIANLERAEALVRIEALKQIAVKGKIAGVIDWVKNFLETEEKLVIFANHRSVVEELSKEFNAPCIYGGMNINKRQEAIDSFQNNPNVRVIVCNMKAAGVGITLTAASNVAFIELGWNPADHDQAEDRCHRIGQKNAVTAWYLLADETIDMDVSDLIEKKRDIVEHAADGKRLENIGMINALFSRLTEEPHNDQDCL